MATSRLSEKQKESRRERGRGGVESSPGFHAVLWYVDIRQKTRRACLLLALGFPSSQAQGRGRTHRIHITPRAFSWVACRSALEWSRRVSKTFDGGEVGVMRPYAVGGRGNGNESNVVHFAQRAPPRCARERHVRSYHIQDTTHPQQRSLFTSHRLPGITHDGDLFFFVLTFFDDWFRPHR